MPDRFTFDSAADLFRNARLEREREAAKCNCSFSGDTADATFCDLHNPMPWRTWGETDAGDLQVPTPFCLKRQQIAEWSDSVEELREALREHAAECQICGDGEAAELPKAA